jgi:sarcosine oxidase subunit beta
MVPKTADVVVIGGGIIGAASAYQLARLGQKVILVERDFLCAGSTGRCICGIRQQFSTELSIKTAMESVALYASMEEELGETVEWYPGGYLFLAHTEEMKARYLHVIPLQQKLGLPVEFISCDDVRKVVPAINPEGILGAAYCTTDGQANPFLVVNAYAHAVRRLGGEIMCGAEVVEFERDHERVAGVHLASGDRIAAPAVLDAAGPWAGEIAEMVDIELPLAPDRHEALVTEGVDQMLEPMLVDYRPDGCYFLQTIGTGHFIGCYTPPEIVPGTDTGSSLEFLQEMPRRMVRLLPALKDIKMLRQWAGSYTMTPDGSPLVGATQVPGFYVAAGMSGHGFMLGPMIGKLVAELVVIGETSIRMDEFRLERDFSRTEAMK